MKRFQFRLSTALVMMWGAGMSLPIALLAWHNLRDPSPALQTAGYIGLGLAALPPLLAGIGAESYALYKERRPKL